MFLRLLALSILCTASPNLAAAREGYWYPERLPSSMRPENFDRALKAFIGIDKGSGTFVSNRGHILMCLHQLVTIFRDLQLFSNRWIHPLELGSGLFIYNAPLRIVEGTRVPITISNAIFGTREVQAEVVYVGHNSSHWIDYKQFDQGALERTLDELEKHDPIQIEDFAVLKVDLGEATPCLKLSATVPKQGTKVWALGRPVPYHLSNLRNGKNWDEPDADPDAGTQRAWVSLGETLAPITEDKKSIFSYVPDLYFNTDAEGTFGFSGGPLIDKNSEIIGVTSGNSLEKDAERATSSKRPQPPEDQSNWGRSTTFDRWQGSRALAVLGLQRRAVQDFAFSSQEIPWARCE